MMQPRTTVPLRLQPASQPSLQGQSQLSAALFTCSTCGKGFDQKRRQTRHSSYCKKSKSQPPKSRKKACIQCTKARSKCDVRYSITTKHPQCARCRTRGIDCHFDRPPLVTQGGPSPPSTFGSEAEGNTSSSPVHSHHEHSGNDNSAIDFALASTSTASVPDLWLEGTKTRGYDELMSEFLMFETDTPALFIQNHRINTPASPLNRIVARPPRSFLPNNESDYGLQFTRRYVVSALKSYPNMLLEHKIPPFIHHSYSFYEENSSSDISLPGPLSVCAGIIQMFSFKNKSNTSFIWRTIRTEQERLAAEVISLPFHNTYQANARTVFRLE
ncbi:hypothetical protein GQ53DRAFT_682010 [Thozetella sp. PMI_491]|nr:hypothetical protein GQ53DRAFT_682010 [Thozetella sp. PMI_491]